MTSWFNKLSVRTRLMLGFLSVAAITAGVGGFALLKLSNLDGMMEEMYSRNTVAISTLKDANTNIVRAGRGVRQLILDTDHKESAILAEEVRGYLKKVHEYLDTARPLLDSAEDITNHSKVDEMYDKLEVKLLQATDLAVQNQSAMATSILNETYAAAKEIGTLTNKLCDSQDAEAKEANEAGRATYRATRTLMLTIIAVGVAVAAVLGYLISSWFTRAVLAVDEIADSVATASQELAAASEHLSSGAQQSASSLEETASSLEEITATVRQNADNADQANQLASSSRATAEKGGAVVAQAVTAMGEINQASRKIADIITTIDEIAFQTNLLALNAAVEAARAGEQGRGFAVVAGEVRNLAQRSATAAREIKGLIEDSVHKVETGSDLVNKSGETLEAIVTSVQRVTDIVGEIAAASREQTVGIEQINRAVSQMDQVTQSNASQTEEMSSTAVALSGQAEQLQTVVAQFNLKRQSHAPTATAARYATATTDTRSVSRTARRKSASTKVKRHVEEPELVGAGAGSDGFEEF